MVVMVVVVVVEHEYERGIVWEVINIRGKGKMIGY
jgi:hypothetical protein